MKKGKAMKITKLTQWETEALEATGLNLTGIDIIIPFGKGPGLFSYCEHCYHQRYAIHGDQSQLVCGNPLVNTGLMDCFYMSRERSCLGEGNH